MQEYNSSSTVQDYGSLPTETSVSMDGASRLLRLADWLRNLGLSLSPRKHVSSQREFPKDVSM